MLNFTQLSIQCFAIDPEHVCGLVLVAAGLLEDLEDIFFLHFIQRQGPFSRVIKHAPIATGPLNRCRKIVRNNLARFG